MLHNCVCNATRHGRPPAVLCVVVCLGFHINSMREKRFWNHVIQIKHGRDWQMSYGGFPVNEEPLKWMVYFMEHPIKMNDLGVAR